jgi:hypothetical protein
MNASIAGIRVPDSQLAKEATELVRDTHGDLLFHHSRRVFFFGALTGKKKGYEFDHDMLYVAAMFHDMGLVPPYKSQDKRFEVDSANAARDFLKQHGVPESEIEIVWDAISLHTTPGIPEFKKPVVALLTSGVEMDVLGLGFDNVAQKDREAVVSEHPRSPQFKLDIIEAFYQGFGDLRHRQCRCAGTEAAEFPSRELLQHHPQFRLAALSRVGHLGDCREGRLRGKWVFSHEGTLAMKKPLVLTLAVCAMALFCAYPSHSHAQNGVGGMMQKAIIQLHQRFVTADTDKDGFVTLEEAKKAGMSATVKHFDEIDTTHRGKVSEEEIKKFFIKQAGDRAQQPAVLG